MIWMLLLSLAIAAPPITSYLDTIGVSILSTDTITGNVCIISNRTVPYYANLFYDGRYEAMTYVSPMLEWCREFNDTYLLRTDPTPALILYGASQGAPVVFCAELPNTTIYCSNSSFEVPGYNISSIYIPFYNGTTIKISSNQTIFLYWQDRDGYQSLGDCSIIPQDLNTTYNQIPYGQEDNLLFYILARFTNSSITYIYQTDPAYNYLGYCDNVVVLDAPVELGGPVTSALIISDYNRGFYPYENGISVLALNNSYSLQDSDYQKPEFALPSEAEFNSANYTTPEIAIGFTAVAALYVQSHTRAGLWELKPLLLATSNKSCDSTGCGAFNATLASTYNALSLYLHPHTKTTAYISSSTEDVVFYSTVPSNITVEASNVSQFKNIFFSVSPSSGNFTVNISNGNDDFVSGVLVYTGDLLSVTSNRTYYRGYFETATLTLKNNNPTMPFYLQSVSVELWNDSGKIVDLYSAVVDLSLKPNQTFILPLTFYIPNDVPDGYVKIKLYSNYTLEGLPVWQKGIEPDVFPGLNVSPLNLTSFTAYKLEIPYYGIMDLKEGFVDFDYLTKSSCVLLDHSGNLVKIPLVNASERYILVCNETLLKPVVLYITYEYDTKNVSTPAEPPISVYLNTTSLYTNANNHLLFTVVNRQVTPISVDGLSLILYNNTDSFTYGLGQNLIIRPGQNLYQTDLFLPDVPYHNYTLMLVKTLEQERAGKGSIYMDEYDESMPVQRVAFGLTQYLSFWVDNITTGVAVSFRRPSTLCRGWPSPETGSAVFWINGQEGTYTGSMYSCGYNAYYIDSSYSGYQSLGVRPGYNIIKYYISPDLDRLRSAYATEVKFTQGIKMKFTYTYLSNDTGSIIHQELPLLPNSSLSYNITTSAQLAEGFLNKLYIAVNNNMETPIRLAYVEVKVGDHWVGGKKYDLPLLPNETFTDVLILYGTIRNASTLTINYVFSYDYEPLVYKLPVPTYIGVCESYLRGPYPCMKENTTYIAQARRYDFDTTDWFIGMASTGEDRWLYRVPIYVPSYVRTLSVYTQDMQDIYYASPQSDPILLQDKPKRGYYYNFPANSFYTGPGLLSFVSSGGAPKIHLKYYLMLNETLNISNPGVLDFLPSTLYYYNFEDQVYLRIENRNPVQLTTYYLQYFGDGDYKEPAHTGYLITGDFSNSTAYFKRPVLQPHSYRNLSYSSPLEEVVITHLGRSLARYATNISNLSLYLDGGYNAYVFQGGISKDFEGAFYLGSETIPINTSALTWFNNSRLVFIPRMDVPNYLIGDFILYTDATEAQLNATRGSFFISGTNCTAVVGDLCSQLDINFSSMGLEAYYLEKDISLPQIWRRGMGDVDVVSRSEFDLSYWPMEDMVPGDYLYAMRLYIPTNLYKMYLPSASTLYINGVEVDTSQLVSYLVYGDDNNIIYTSDASNPYALPVIIYGLPTVYSSFNVRNLSIYPGGYQYVGTPQPFTLTFNLTNYGNVYEYINIVSGLPVEPTYVELPELESILINVTIPELPEGDYIYYLNITTTDGNISMSIPIVLNLTEEYINFEANISPAFFNITAPENATGTITLYSNSSRDIIVSIDANASGIEVPDQILLHPNETKTILFEIQSLYFGDSKNVSFVFTTANLTKTQTIEVLVYNPLPTNISFNISADPTTFNLTRPENATGILYITSNSSQRTLYNIYTDHPAVIVQSYVLVDPNTTVEVPFNVSSLYLNDNATAHIFVNARNVTQNVSLTLILNLPEGLIIGNYTKPDNRLRLILGKTLLCVGEETPAYVYDGYGRYIDGAEIVTSLGSYIANEGKAIIKFDRPGSFYVRAIADGYERSRTIYVLVEECNKENLNPGNLSIKELQPSVNVSLPQVKLTYEETILPTQVSSFRFEVPDQVLVNTSAFIRVYDSEGKPFVGIIKVTSPSGQERFYTTDSKGYALVFFDSPGVYKYEVIYQGKSYPGPQTLATIYIQSTTVSITRLPAWPWWILLLLLGWFIVKVEVVARKEGTLIGRVVNILGLPVKNADVIIKANGKKEVVKTDNNGVFKAKVGVQKVKIGVKWRIALGDTTSEHEKLND